MAKQEIVWTVLPHGRIEEGRFAGRLRVSIVVSPRLKPSNANEQVLKAFADWPQWPETLRHARFALEVGAQSIDLQPITKPSLALWSRLFSDETPVAGFEFRDMSKVNLRSFAVRNVLGTLRKHYGRLAVQSAASHPTLLPWKDAHPGLKDMLTELGTRTQKINFGDRAIEVPLPGFDRFFDDKNKEGIESRVRGFVFGKNTKYTAPRVDVGADGQGNPTQAGTFPIRVLPPDWQDPAWGRPDAPLMSQWSSAGEYTLWQANRFYRREPPSDEQLAMRRPDPANVAPPPKAPEFDFHRIVASFADYPLLLRELGLVIDCALPADSPLDQMLVAATPVKGVMGLKVKWDNGHLLDDDRCPRTAWYLDKTRFTSRPRTADHERGLLRLEHADDRWGPDKRSPFDVYQVDPDGAALKTVDFVLSAQNLVAKSLQLGADGEVTYTTGDKQPVAALRSAGLGVSRHGRAAAIAQGAASNALKDKEIAASAAAARKVVLFTEDVLRGYRADVQALPPGQAPQGWRSLCRRVGTYRFVNSADTIPLAGDEGYVKGASTSSTATAGVDPDDHYLHESLFRWTGWSLVAARPGRTVRAHIDPASGVQNEVPEDVKDEAADGSGLAVTFVVAKGSLPKLRYGMPYRLRARIVDLAGNSLALEDKSLDTDENVTQPVAYWRFEPVDPPALVQRAHTSEGESLERMVIRSNWNANTNTYLSTPSFATAIALPASADFEYTAISERHAVPPKASQLQCEQHGAFDAMLSNAADIKTAYAIAARESGTLYDAGANTQIELVTPSAAAGIATTNAVPPRLPTPANPTGDRIAAGQYVIHREALVDTPYLPDPAAGGFALRAAPGHGLPGVTAPMVLGPSAAVVLAPDQELVLLVAHGKEWPDSQGLRVVLAEREAALTDPPCDEAFIDDGAPKWDEDARALTLFVPKGRIVRLLYSSFVHKAFIGTFGLPSWVDSAGERDFVLGMAQAGCGWMITPFRPLTLVHATQAPVCKPEFLVLGANRNLGDAKARLDARIRLHGPSTGKFEVEANWYEWVDDPAEKPLGPERVPAQGALGEVLLAENHVNLFGLGDAVTAQMHDAAKRPRARGDDHEFGDTKFRLIRYTLRGTTRFREYLPGALYEQRDEVTRVGPIAQGPAMIVGADDDPGAPVLRAASGTGQATIVRASAPPDVPRVMYTVPTFRWLDAPSGAGANARLDTSRLGNGLRVWLDRPWFSSGDGELLGVVILGDDRPFTDISQAMVPLVTQWGLDPLWDTVLPKARTRVADFGARVTDEQVTLRERDEAEAGVAMTVQPLLHARVTDFPALVLDEMVLLQELNATVRVIGHRVRWDETRRLWYCDIELDPGRSYMPFVRLALVRYQPNALPKAKISKVVLAEFAQVLPRRRAVFQRNGSQLEFSLRGTVPQFGPMRFPLDSEYEDISFIPGFGQATETGRNKVELVMQTRDPQLDTDLAWSDLAVIASSLVAPPGSSAVQPGSIFAMPARHAPAKATVQDRLGRRVDFGSAVSLDPIHAGPIVGPGIERPPIVEWQDPPIWQTSVTLPDARGKPARIAVREYERYYTDRTVPEVRAGATRRRRVVEERLVYTALFDL